MKSTRLSTTGVWVLACMMVGSASDACADSGNDTIEEVIVRAHPLSAEGLAQPVSTLSGDKLQRRVAASIGETLAGLSGVHSSSFGQAVGRPVIRGLGGPRVKVMEDRIDSLDVSVTSPDHLTTVEPFSADSIEVLKGPSTLLYGTGAIGGVVDVHTGRIPHDVPESASAQVELRGADNADRRTSAVRLDTSAGAFAFHLDGFYRDADDYDIPGSAESTAQRALEQDLDEHEDEHEGDEHAGEAETYGRLPGSRMRAHGGAVGLSRIGDSGFVGLSISTYEADYGLPGHQHHHHHHEEEDEEHAEDEHGHDEAHDEHAEEGNPNLELEQTRIDFEAGLSAPFAGIDSINFRVGRNDYEHTEVEGSGEVGTRFTTEALEGRLEFVHAAVAGLKGSFGLQASQREFAASGEEAFVLPVDTESLGVFYLGERLFGEYQLEAGVRIEWVEHDPTGNRSRRFGLEAVSIGLIRPLGGNWTLTAQVDHSSRAPVAEELYSNGPHLVTSSFEIGDPTLEEEVAANVAASLQYQSETFRFALSAYRTDFSDFIYEAPTGAEIEELRVLRWQQGDALFKGFEIDLSWRAVQWNGGHFALNAGMDVVDARLSGAPENDLPRIPPNRWRLDALLQWDRFTAEIGYTRVDDQSDVAFGELPTRSYENLSGYLGYRAQFGGTSVEIFLRGDNLTDDDQRYHTSFIKDLAPQPGRTIEGGVRIRI